MVHLEMAQVKPPTQFKNIYDSIYKLVSSSACLDHNMSSTCERVWKSGPFKTGIAHLGGRGENACPDGLGHFFGQGQGYPFTNLRIVYLMHILIAFSMQTLYSRYLCHGVQQKIKHRVRKKFTTVPVWQRGGGSKAIRAMSVWMDHFSKRGLH